ncbi:hypothetical protein EC988_006826, partial [Linderina pennispora]
MSVTRYGAAFLGLGAVALLSTSLQTIAYAKAIRHIDKAEHDDLGTLSQMPMSSINASVLSRLLVAVGGVSLLPTLVFFVCDLSGLFLLGSRLHRYAFEGVATHRNKQHSFDMHRHSVWSIRDNHHDLNKSRRRHRLAWWRRWMAVEELVLWMQRNIACLRMCIAVALALIWSPLVIQVSAVGMTGRCRAVFSDRVEDMENTIRGCDLLRIGTIGIFVTWTSWTCLAVMLVLLNTHSTHMYFGYPPYLPSGMPMVANTMLPIGAGYFMGMRPPAFSMQTAPQYPPFQHPPTGASYHHPTMAPGHQQSTGSSSTSSAPRKLPISASTHLRSSWSQLDDESGSEMARSDIQSFMQHSRAAYQQQSLFQFYHHQNQQFSHQFQPAASRPSVDQMSGAGKKQQPAARKSTARSLEYADDIGMHPLKDQGGKASASRNSESEAV